MTCYLLDVNALVALFDPAHVHHDRVHRWYARRKLGTPGKGLWATCPITENGFIRVVSHPAYPNPQPLIGKTLDLFARFLNESQNHRFWPDSVSLSDSSLFRASAIAGHRQVTDVYLLGLCQVNRGRLATLDARLAPNALVGGSDELVEPIS